MADSINAGSGGGIHPGAPVIWPSSKNVQQVKQVQQAQSSGQAAATAAQTAKEAASATEHYMENAQQAAQSPTSPSIARNISKGDIAAQLVAAGLTASEENIQLALNLLQHGLELSSENFKNIFNFLKGKGLSARTLKPALVALGKGLQAEPGAFKALDSFFGSNPQLAGQLFNLHTAINNFQGTLAQARQLLNPQLVSQLGAILTQLDEKYQKLLTGQFSKNDLATKLMRGEMIKEQHVLKSLLFGLAQKLANTPNQSLAKAAKQLSRAFVGLGRDLDGMLQNLVAQSILSKPGVRQDTSMPDKYSYWQIPNLLAKNPSTIELLLKRDETSQEKEINPKRTRVILKLNADELGEITVIVDVEEKKLWYIFNHDNEAAKEFIMANAVTLRERMDQLSFNVRGIQAIHRRVDTKRYVIPTIDMNNLRRISTEV